MNMTIQKITKMAIIVALYVVLTNVFSAISYGNIQFRVAEILVLLCFYKRDYAIPLILACALANLQSPLIADVLFGTAGTVFAVLGIIFISHFKKHFHHESIALFIASLFPVVSNAVWVGMELHLYLNLPFFASAFSVAVGEFAVVSLFGVFVFASLSKNKTFMRMLFSDAPFKSYDGQEDSPK
jgi:uncharacterized membrane protein